MSITVDDLPYAGDLAAASPIRVNRKLLAAFKRHHVPVTGFVIQKRVEDIGPAVGTAILKEWISQGFDLGNHTYSHPDTNDLSVEQIEEEIVRGEATFLPLMQRTGKAQRFFRFPYNHTGDTEAKHDAIAEFLAQRGYKLATCTIDTSDYIFNNAYLRMLAKKDDPSAKKLRVAYLAYTSAEIDYYAGLNRKVFGYEPPEVMLLHDNLLNAELIDQILAMFEQKRYKFVSLATAQSDAAYGTPEFITKSGQMWGYRWASERNVKYDGRLEPDPPAWISSYGTKDPVASAPYVVN
ncbi:MAG TPA: polysaccharide deacetylase family protein [Bryobacteraceae bacterium]